MIMPDSLITQKDSNLFPSPLHSSSPPSTTDPCKLPQNNLQEGLPAETVHKRALEARAHMARAQRALCFWLVEMEKRSLYRHFGCSSVFQYGECYLELAPHTIAEYLRSGKEMEKLPLLAEACEKGEVSASKLREISRVAVPETEKTWLAIARTSTYRQIEKLVPLTPKGGLPLAAHCSAARECEKTQGVAPEMQGKEGVQAIPLVQEAQKEEGAGAARYRTKIVIELDNDRLAVIMDALEKAQKETGEKDRGALLEHMARLFLDNVPSRPGEGVPYRVTVHHIPEKGVAWIEGNRGPLYVGESTVKEALCDAEILDLGPVKDPVRDKASCDLDIKEHMASGQGDSLRHGPHLRRTIAPTLRRKVLERDGHQCTAPGCGNRRHLSLHHIVPVASGGSDRAGNLTTVCSRCHRALHWSRLSLGGEAPGTLVWRNRNGLLLKGSNLFKT
jgi:hypothetical protein